jgi:peroxiredoxin
MVLPHRSSGNRPWAVARIYKRRLSERADPEDGKEDCRQALEEAVERQKQMMPRIISSMAVSVIVAFMTALNAQTAERPALLELLKALNVSAYPSLMHPPDFSGLTADGQRVSLASLSGRVLVLNFWATWCLECRPEMPAFERLHRELSAQGLAVVGINAREGTSTIREYAKELGLTFPLILDPKGTINTAYGVIGLPTTFLIGRDGRPVALAIGPREWSGKPARALIQALLAEPAALKARR